MSLPGTMPVGLAVALAVAAFVLGGFAARYFDNRRVTRGEANTAAGLGRDWLQPGPTGLVAFRLGLPSWVHMHTRIGRVDRTSGLKDEVPVLVKEVTSDQPAAKPQPTEPDAVGLESGRVVMPIARARLWGDQEGRAGQEWRTKGGPLPQRPTAAEPAEHPAARINWFTAAYRRARARVAIALLIPRPRRRTGGRHRKTRGEAQ